MSVSVSGYISADVMKSTMLLKYNDFMVDPNVLQSFEAYYIKQSRRMQFILLAHFLHTWQAYRGAAHPDVTYLDDGFDVTAIPDNFSEMRTMIMPMISTAAHPDNVWEHYLEPDNLGDEAT